MRDFRFRLERVLELQRQQLRQAERQLSRLAEERNRWQQELLSLESLLREPSTAAAGYGREPLSSTVWDARYRYFEGIQARIREAQEKLHAVTAEWQAARDAYGRLASKTDALESLRKKRQSEHAYEFSRLEQLQLDDHVLRQRAGDSDG